MDEVGQALTDELGSVLGSPVATNNTCAALNEHTPACTTQTTAPDRAYYWTAPSTGMFTFTTTGATFDTVLLLLDASTHASLGCNDDASSTTFQSSVTVNLTAGTRVKIVVDGYSTRCGDFALNISAPTFAGCAAVKAAIPSAPDGEYVINPTGARPISAYCDMRLGVELCTEDVGVRRGRTREGSNLDYVMMSLLARTSGLCSVWALRGASDNRPIDALVAAGNPSMGTCQALGFVSDGTITLCDFGSERGTCGYNVSSGYYRYGNGCMGCSLNDGYYTSYKLQGPMRISTVISSMDGSTRSVCRTR
ncbi:fibrinogen-like YCDxxxxGGGW domain-containing protein [Myxococcus sp. CA040A]|uniref:fibrinogen-like YCDxxxxGGGW domain-containing protein n=1 Tax=Myxococcus sp. CA040A TaxID=2741738 RepID=UPI00157B7643|nr:hypothetical protein [Myxococcus sp. CA040A]